MNLQYLLCQPNSPSVNLKISVIQKGGGFIINKNDTNVIFVKYFRHWKTGKMVYPKNGKVIAIRLKNKSKKK